MLVLSIKQKKLKMNAICKECKKLKENESAKLCKSCWNKVKGGRD